MDRLGKSVAAIALVGSPLLILAYFVTYPAYGELHADAIARDLSADPGMTQAADVFALRRRLPRPFRPRSRTCGSCGPPALASPRWAAEWP